MHHLTCLRIQLLYSQAAVSTAHTITTPIGNLATSIGEGGKGLLQMPLDAAKTGARMGSGLVMVRSTSGTGSVIGALHLS